MQIKIKEGIIKENILFIFLAALLMAAAVLQLTIPLTKFFSFEYSVVNSILITFFISIITIQNLHKKNPESYRDFNTGTASNLFLFFIIPLIIAFINTVLKNQCPFYHGLPYYFTIVFPAIFVGRGIGIFVFCAIRRFRNIGLIFVYLLILTIPLIEFYLNPQVYFYNPIFSFFPGNIYDESIRVDVTLITYRLINLIFFESIAVIYFLSKKIEFRRGIIVIYTLITSLIFIILSPYLGFSTNMERIKRKLPVSEETANIRFHYGNEKTKKEMSYSTFEAEYYYHELSEYYKTEPDKKIDAFVFKDSGEKRDIFGAGNADVAKPWMNQIYLSEQTLNRTLKHEMSHVFTSKFGKYVFEVADKINPVLIEGIATASEGFYDDYPLHYLAFQAYKNGYLTELPELFSGLNFFAKASSSSYLTSGSFVKFLVDKYGIEKFKLLYRDIDFMKHYGKDIATLNKEYIEFISIQDFPSNKAVANYYFGRKGLIQKNCPRYISAKTEEIFELIAKRNYLDAKEIISELELKNTSWALTYAMIECNQGLGEIRSCLRYIENKETTYKGTAYEEILAIRKADMLFLDDQTDKAMNILVNILSTSSVHRVYFLAKTRIILSEKMVIKEYIMGNEETRAHIFKKIFLQTSNISLIPAIQDKINYQDKKNDWILEVVLKGTVKNNYEKYALIKLSELLARQGNYGKAKQILDKAKKPEGECIFNELLKSVELKLLRLSEGKTQLQNE